MADTTQTEDTAGEAVELTHHNLKSFNTANRRETAHRRGISTSSRSPNFHSYWATVTTAHLPPPSQRRAQRPFGPKRTESAKNRSLKRRFLERMALKKLLPQTDLEDLEAEGSAFFDPTGLPDGPDPAKAKFVLPR